jgi:PEP-CTERM motif
MKIKQITQAVLGLIVTATASSAMAATGDAIITLQQAGLNTNNWIVAQLGNAVYTNTTPLSSVALPVSTVATASFIDYGDADGLKISFAPNFLGTRPNISLSNFSFDIATKTILGNAKYGTSFNLATAEPVLSIATLTDVGGNLLASGISMHPSLQATVADLGLDPNAIPLSSIISSLTFSNYGFVAAVPEPSTYALMGLGLVGISLVARRRQA